MSLTKVQRTFARLASQRYLPFGGFNMRRRRKIKSKSKSKSFQNEVRIEIIDAVTGQQTSAKAFEESTAKLRKWLKLRNVRAEFTGVILKKSSAWFTLPDEAFIDYPIIVKVGTYKVPYLIKRVQDRKTLKGKTTITIQLETAENVNYLSILSAKKELLANRKKGSK